MADNYVANQYERYQARKAEIARKNAKAKADALERYKKKLEAKAASQAKK